MHIIDVRGGIVLAALLIVTTNSFAGGRDSGASGVRVFVDPDSVVGDGPIWANAFTGEDDPDGPGATDLQVSKSGNDVILSWTGTGTAYDGARATDAPFTNATTQFISVVGTSHTYVGAVGNVRSLEFFDVTDESEGNRGGNWNGGVLQPQPPVIDAEDPSTNIGNLFIGGTGIIGGSGFSSIPEVNTVCFAGGVCTQATSSSPSQIQFVTPPGAYSGAITVTVGSQTSEPVGAVVHLDDPTVWESIAELTFSRKDRSYWVKATLNNPTGAGPLFRLYFDPVTEKWLREDRGGAALFFINCSAQTSPTGRIFCAGQPSTGETSTRIIDTSPPSTVVDCIDFEATSPLVSIFVTSSAVDPNPDGLRTNAAYFSTFEGGTGLTRIRKVAHDCSAVLDDNYGDFASISGAKNGSAVVDPRTGDFYFADEGEIWRITTAENVSLVRAGLPTNTRLGSLTQEGAGDPGTLLLHAGGLVQALALDNLSADPISVATSAAGIGTEASFGAQVSGGPWIESNVNRTVTVYSDFPASPLAGGGDAVLILAPHPLVAVTESGPFQVRISSPKAKDEEQLPVGQSEVRPSTFGNTGYSHAVAKLQYHDGLSRPTCAWTGDPGPGAPQYDPSPPVPSDCNKPRNSAAICDNVDDIVVGGPGSFVETGDPIESCKTCGGTLDPCQWEFRITNRYAGDNYKVYFAFDEDAEQFVATSDVYTAWKHVHIERERMCSEGGVLFRDYGATGQCGVAGQPACCGTGSEPPCDEVLVYNGSNVGFGELVVVFDEADPFETAGYTRTVDSVTNNGDGSLTLKLSNALPRSYRASTEYMPGVSPHVPDFDNLHSGGVCVPSAGFIEADVSDLRQPYNDALVDYHIPTYGLPGPNVIPRLWPNFFDLANRPCALDRFSHVWNSTFQDSGNLACAGPDGQANGVFPNNSFHVMPATDTVETIPPAGFSNFLQQYSFLLDDQIIQDCQASSMCTAVEEGAMRRWTCGHEVAHLFDTNSCSACTFFHEVPTRQAWCGGPGGSCVVPPALAQDCIGGAGTSVPELDMRADGVDRFCQEDLTLGDPNCSMAPDPTQGAIRAQEDPQ